MSLIPHLSEFFDGADVSHVTNLQELWSGYGSIARYRIDTNISDKSDAQYYANHSFFIIVKSIDPPRQQQHPRGWNSDRSHQRKLRSYQVESHWYQQWASLCNPKSRVPHCFGVMDVSESHQCILLEDLDSNGFDQRHSELTEDQCLPCLQWLANFHAIFLRQNDDSSWTQQLWPQGSYWHLATRPDEWKAMAQSPLKRAAAHIDSALENSQFTTLIHGDAKVANFCFSADGQNVAAVDFQYVGAGCGIKDIVYFLGSCLSEKDCERHHSRLLDLYFLELSEALTRLQSDIDLKVLERDWRLRYPLAWADFQRFIVGWAPNHKKNHHFAQAMTQLALDQLTNHQ